MTSTCVKSPRFTASGNIVSQLLQHKQIKLTMKAVTVVSRSVNQSITPVCVDLESSVDAKEKECA